MINLLLQWLPLGLLLVLTIVVLLALHREKQTRLAMMQRVSELESALTAAHRQQDSLSKQFHELRAGSIGMSDMLAKVGQQLEFLEDRQGELSMHDPNSKLYSRASRMVELGADLHELMEECELPKAEAELLMNLQSQMTRRR
ncbi:DUF2802 domain-containing protein [Thaumasiovibrio sp. DFM-14]|uniref:DUF2802 domain-containing protein n=1 Tax=Thaumasiovibrio sp. DFM-14 TaxID=3384792 RepID=UPI0039A309B0